MNNDLLMVEARLGKLRQTVILLSEKQRISTNIQKSTIIPPSAKIMEGCNIEPMVGIALFPGKSKIHSGEVYNKQ